MDLIDLIEKAKKASPVGTEKTWGGKVYIKTATGWKPKGKGKSSSEEEESSSKDKKVDHSEHASKASDEQLNAALKDKDAPKEVREAAKKELENRQGKTEENKGDKENKEVGISSALQRILDAQEKGELDLDEEVLNKIKNKIAESKKKKEEQKPLDEKTLDSKLEKLKNEIAENIDNKLNEMNGFKKITQTYVKSNGQTIVLNMKGDDKYKTKKGSFYMESKPYESLIDFKKRVKEEFEKTQDKEEESKSEEKKPEEPKKEEKVSNKPVTLNGKKGAFVTIEPEENSFGKTHYKIEAFDSDGKKVLMTNYQNSLDEAKEKGNEMLDQIPDAKKEEDKPEEKPKTITKVNWTNPGSGIVQWSKIKDALNSGIAEVERNGKKYHIEKVTNDNGSTVYKVTNLKNNISVNSPSLYDIPIAMIGTEESKSEKDGENNNSSNGLHFKNKKEINKYTEKRNKLTNTLDEDQSKRLEDAFKSVEDFKLKEGNEKKDFESTIEIIKEAIEERNFNKILEKYGHMHEKGRVEVNKLLVESGYLPIANGVLYHNFNGVEYKHFVAPFDLDSKELLYEAQKYYDKQGEKLNATKQELKAIKIYMGQGYSAIRNYNYGQVKNDSIADRVEKIESLINKNPCEENLILNRRVEIKPSNLNILNEWLSAEVGSIIEDKSFSSFSLRHLKQFGNDLQITLLAKKGDKVSNVNNQIAELEYVVQRNSKYKVVAKGTNSIVVELV